MKRLLVIAAGLLLLAALGGPAVAQGEIPYAVIRYEGGQAVRVYTNPEARRYRYAIRVTRNRANSNAYIRNVVQKRPERTRTASASPHPIRARWAYFTLTQKRRTPEGRFLHYASRGPGGQWVPRALDLAALIEREAKRFGVDPALVELIIKYESNFDPYAVSRSGARGLMQLMPATAAELGVDDIYDPSQNVRGGTAYFARQLRRFRDLSLALAAYNAGPRAVVKHGGIPPFAETRAYVHRIVSEYRALQKGRRKQAGGSGRPRRHLVEAGLPVLP